MRTRLAVLTLFVAVVLAASPLITQAVTANELRAQIADLLAQIYVLRGQIQTNAPVAPTPLVPSIPVPVTPAPGTTFGNTNAVFGTVTGPGTFQYSRCPNLQFNLERGVRDGAVAVEVTMLQRFLSQDRALYPEGLVTGFFGPATERAVQRFQERHGIVSYGDYKATGYGRVGPRTRHAIKHSCGSTASNHGFSVSPVAGAAPLQVTAVFDATQSTCTSYVIDWGDGSSPVAHQVFNSGASCSDDTFRKQLAYTYTQPGTYVVTLKLGQGNIHTLPLVARATVTVQAGYGGSGGVNRSSVFLSASEGPAPLHTTLTLRSETGSSCTSYSVDWGDGTQPITYQAANSGFCTRDIFSKQFTHTYTTPGVYLVQARAGVGPLSTITTLTQPIRVTNQVVGGPVTGSCFVSPQSGLAPLQATARILLGGTLCDGQLTYQVDWGDGTLTPSVACSDQNSHYEELRHTYNQTGTYTARLMQQHPNARFTEQSCSISVGGFTGSGGGVTVGGGSGSVPTNCRSWYDGCNTCDRDYIGGPARCTTRACTTYGASQCQAYFTSSGGGTLNTNTDSLSARIVNSSLRTVEFTALINTNRSCNGGVYTIYFGDTNDSLQPYPADACQLFTRTVSHTYSQNGTYTALLLRDGIEVDRVTVTVSGTSSSVNANLAAVYATVADFVKGLFGN